MYKVIKFFTDLKDNGHAYKVGDTFPRKGLTVSAARLEQLSGNKNRQGTPLIEAVPEPTPAKENEEIEAIANEVEAKQPPKKRGKKKNS